MFDSTSATEKIGWLGLMGGIFVALVQAGRWVSNFGSEHEAFKAHLLRAEPILARFPVLEAANLTAQRERQEMLEEIKGLRKDINDLFRYMLQKDRSD